MKFEHVFNLFSTPQLN